MDKNKLPDLNELYEKLNVHLKMGDKSIEDLINETILGTNQHPDNAAANKNKSILAAVLALIIARELDKLSRSNVAFRESLESFGEGLTASGMQTSNNISRVESTFQQFIQEIQLQAKSSQRWSIGIILANALMVVVTAWMAWSTADLARQANMQMEHDDRKLQLDRRESDIKKVELQQANYRRQIQILEKRLKRPETKRSTRSD